VTGENPKNDREKNRFPEKSIKLLIIYTTRDSFFIVKLFEEN
jgi:hypothetical protein